MRGIFWFYSNWNIPITIIIIADIKPEYLPKILDKKLLPIFKPKINISILNINVKIVVRGMLIPDILAPRPRAKLFTLSASASEIASLT